MMWGREAHNISLYKSQNSYTWNAFQKSADPSRSHTIILLNEAAARRKNQK